MEGPPRQRLAAVAGAYMRIVRTTALVLGGLMAAGGAWAQQAPDGPKTQTIQVVERGVFLESEFGFTAFVATLADAPDTREYGAATQIGVFAGYDVLPILSLGLGIRVLATGVSGDLGSVSGDLYYVAPTLSARLAVLTTERNFVWVRADVGLALASPAKIDDIEYGGIGPSGSVMVTYERFTKLRHFSIGVSAGASFVMKPSVGIGITVLPHVKYTF